MTSKFKFFKIFEDILVNMSTGLKGFVVITMSLLFLGFTFQDGTEEDECPCKAIEELSQKDLLCMNSCALIYSCINGVDVLPDEVFSYECTIYTGEETILRRYDKDELPLVIKNNILKAKKMVIRGVRLKSSTGGPSDRYLRKPAKIKFNKRLKYRN